MGASLSAMTVRTQLRSGFSTGSHAAAAFKGALRLHFFGEAEPACVVPLPAAAGHAAPIHIDLETVEWIKIRGRSHAMAASRKQNNDDEDVTKGILLRCDVTDDPDMLTPFLNPQSHMPHVLAGTTSLPLHVFAGRGLGVATQPGLRVAPGYPAINPGPLSVLEHIYNETLTAAHAKGEAWKDRQNGILYAVFSIDDGESIALKTANRRVGVIGGLSLLGSQGIVKPLSSSAYLESLRAEISVARHRGGEIFFVLGNPALRYVESLPPDANRSVIETGNFVFDSLSLLADHSPSRLTFVAGAGKMTRLAHGFRNTHQKFGELNPSSVLDFAIQDADSGPFPRHLLPHIRNCPRDSVTVRAIEEHLREENAEAAGALLQTIARRGAATLLQWSRECDLRIQEIGTVLIDSTGRPWSTLAPSARQGTPPECRPETGEPC